MTFNSIQPFKAVLLDLDGTLVDSLSHLRSAYFEFLNAHGIIGTNEEFANLTGPSLSEIVAILKNKYSLANDPQSLYREYLDCLQDKYARDIQPMPGAEALMDWLNNSRFEVALVSSAPLVLAETFLARQEWKPFFKEVVTGDMVKNAKPHPEIYSLALSKLRIANRDAIALEDSANGLTSARKAGVQALGLTDEGLLKSGAAMVLPNLDAARELFAWCQSNS